MHLEYTHRPLWSIKVHLYIHGISMLLERLVVEFEAAPPTTAELCTTSVNMVRCWEVRSSKRRLFKKKIFLFVQTLFRAQMAISFCGLYKLRRRSLPCVGRTAVFCGRRGRLRLRGASVPFWLVVVRWRGGSLVCLWLGVWREARGPVVRVICWDLLAGFTHMHILVQKGTHQASRSRHIVIFIARHTHCTGKSSSSLLSTIWTSRMHSHRPVHLTCSPAFSTDSDNAFERSLSTTGWLGKDHPVLQEAAAVTDSAASVVFKGHMWSPGPLGCWGGHCLCFLPSDRWHGAQKLPLWHCRMEPAPS